MAAEIVLVDRGSFVAEDAMHDARTVSAPLRARVTQAGQVTLLIRSGS